MLGGVLLIGRRNMRMAEPGSGVMIVLHMVRQRGLAVKGRWWYVLTRRRAGSGSRK